MKQKGYLLFSIVVSLVIVTIAIIVNIIAYPNGNQFEDFPLYNHSQYIDRSEDGVFRAGAGAQIYELEYAELTGDCATNANFNASNGHCVENFSGKDSLKFTIVSDKACEVKFVLCASFISENSKDTYAQNLFLCYLNNTELAIRNATVANCYNGYDFRENVMGSFDLSAGENTLEFITREDKSFKLDYMTLVPKEERTIEEESIGVKTFQFYALEALQKFEAEYAEGSNVAVERGENASAEHYAFGMDGACEFDFYPKSDAEIETSLNICLKNDTERPFSSVFNVSVNGTPLQVSGTIPSSTDNFFQMKVGKIALQRGVNQIKIKSLVGGIYLDYIALNADINYSAKQDMSIRYEAEEAECEGAYRIEQNERTSGGAIVHNLSVGASQKFTIYSTQVQRSYLSLSIGYVEDNVLISDILSISVNDSLLIPEELSVRNTNGIEYVNFACGWIDIRNGKNTVIITCKGEGYSLDYITFSTAMFSTQDTEKIYEGENAALIGNCTTELNNTASGGVVVGYNSPGTAIAFTILSDETRSVDLSLSLCYFNNMDALMRDYIKITINGVAINIDNVPIRATGDWYNYALNYVKQIRLEKGINTITITSQVESYNLDYLKLERVIVD